MTYFLSIQEEKERKRLNVVRKGRRSASRILNNNNNNKARWHRHGFERAQGYIVCVGIVVINAILPQHLKILADQESSCREYSQQEYLMYVLDPIRKTGRSSLLFLFSFINPECFSLAITLEHSETG